MTGFPKEKHFRSKKFLDLAKGEECFLNIPGICSHNPNDQTVVAAHSADYERMHGKSGHAVKAHDIFSIPACRPCHDYLDGRSHFEAPVSIKQQDFNRAHAKWLIHLLKEGKIKVV